MLVLALLPLVPRPAVLPLDASPRPSRVFGLCAPGAGRRWCTFRPALPRSVSVVSAALVPAARVLATSVHLLHRDQVTYHLDHAADLRPVGLDDAFADPVQPERAQRVALRPGAADLRLRLSNFQVCHLMLPLSCSARRRWPLRPAP